MVKGRKNTTKYEQTPEANVPQSLKKLKLKRTCLFQPEKNENISPNQPLNTYREHMFWNGCHSSQI